MSDPIVFRIRPRDTSLYFEVRVFDTITAMRQYAWTTKGRSRHVLGNRFVALASGYRVISGKTGRMTREIGQLLFVRSIVGSGQMSHEVAHAALGYARRRGWDLTQFGPDGGLVTADEERFCDLVGHLVRQLHVQLYRRKVFT